MRLDPHKFREVLELATSVHLRKEMDYEDFEKLKSEGQIVIDDFVDACVEHLKNAGVLGDG